MTDQLTVRRALASAVLAFAALPAAAQILGTSARQQPSGSLKLLAYYQGVSEQTVNFSVAGARNCTAQNGTPFACGDGGDIEGSGSGSAGLVKIVGQIGDYVQPYAVIGTGDYSLSLPSTTVSNKLTGAKAGFLYGGGVKFSVVPDTQFDTAIALDLGLTRASYDFSRITPGGIPGQGPIDDNLVLMTYQVAVEASHRFPAGSVKLEPYGGIKWVRVEADLNDRTSGSHAGGKKDMASPFVGLRVPAAERVAFFAEGSFVGGYHYGAGLELRFK